MKKNSIAKGVVVGTGIAAVAAAVAGTYFLYGAKDAKKNRKKLKIWTLRAKAEILEKLQAAAEVNEQVYQKIISEVSEKYQSLKEIDKSDIDDFVEELKGHWKHIAKELGIDQKKSKKTK